MLHCNECYKKHHNVVLKNCEICYRLSFDEYILCDLLRFSEKDNDITCFAFKPNLSIVGESKKADKIEDDTKEIVGLSNKHKWLRALAMQKWKSNPDEVFCELNFHICLISRNRDKILSNIMDDLFSVFFKAATLFENVMIDVLYVSNDHIHLYITTSPDYSIDEVVNKAMSFVEAAVKDNDPELFRKQARLFEKSYFAETIS